MANPDPIVDEHAEETPETDEDILQVTNLTKIYPDGTLAVDDISFNVKRGDFCVLIGPSGCGKSTTLHSLVGKIPATEGSVVLGGEDITTTPTYERDIGLVFQDFQLFPHLSVEGNIQYGLKNLDFDPDEAEERVSAVVEMMHLERLTDRSPKELSAGQKQRVALARSLVLQPKLLLLDEPLGDMDYKLQKRMERELLRIHRELDTTFVYVTHDQTQAMRLGDQVIVMNDGKIEHSGPVEEVYNQPNTAFVATFVGDSNIFHGEIAGIEDDGAIAVVDTDFGTFRAGTANLHSAPDDVVGQQMPFAVRPQFLHVGDEHANTLEGRLDDNIYQPGSGTQLILTIENDDGVTKELQLKSPDRLTVDPDADRITLGWEPADTILLEKTSVLEDIDLEEDILGE